MGLRTHFSSLTAGGSGRTGGRYAQCVWYSAPAATQRFSTSFCASVSVFLVRGGGITLDGSSQKMR